MRVLMSILALQSAIKILHIEHKGIVGVDHSIVNDSGWFSGHEAAEGSPSVAVKAVMGCLVLLVRRGDSPILQSVDLDTIA